MYYKILYYIIFTKKLYDIKDPRILESTQPKKWIFRIKPINFVFCLDMKTIFYNAKIYLLT